jgi:hypothetical protein
MRVDKELLKIQHEISDHAQQPPPSKLIHPTNFFDQFEKRENGTKTMYVAKIV